MLYQICARCHANVTVTSDTCLPCEADQRRAQAKLRYHPPCVMCGGRIPPHHRGSFVCSDQCQLSYDASMADQLATEDGLLY